MKNLTPRQVEVLRATQEATRPEAAAQLGISVYTLREHIALAEAALGLEGRQARRVYVDSVDRACQKLREVADE